MLQESKNTNTKLSGTEMLNMMDRSKASSALKIKVSGQLYFIPLDDIFCFVKDRRKIICHTLRGSISFYGRFCEIMPFLDHRFVCCHKSFVLNMAEIRHLEKGFVVMSNGMQFKFGKHCFQRLLRYYREWQKVAR